MTYDPYKVKTDELEARILLLEKKAAYDQTIQEGILMELQKTNMYLSEMADFEIGKIEITQEN